MTRPTWRSATASRPQRYPDWRHWSARPPTTSRGAGCGPGLRVQVAQPVRRPRQPHRPRRRDHRQEGRGAARAPRRRDPQPPPQRAGLRPQLDAVPADLRGQSWDRQAVHTLFDGLEFQVLRTRLFEALPSRGGGGDRRLRLRRLDAGLDTGELPAGWPSTPPGGTGRRPPGRALAGRHGNLPALAFATEGGRRLRLTDKLDARDRRRSPPGSGTPQPKVLHDAKGPMLAFAAGGMPWPGSSATPRLGVPRPSRPALLRPGRPDGPLPQARAAPGAGRRRPAQPRGLDGDAAAAAGETDAARPRGARPRRGARRRARGARRHPPAHRVELPLVDVLARMERRYRGRRRAPRALEDQFATEVKQAAEEAFAVIGKEINLGSPKQLQVVLFDELGCRRPSGPRPATPPTPTRCRRSTSRPSTRSCCTCSGTATSPGSGRPSRGCSRRSRRDGRIHTTFNQLIAATGRLSSTDPNLQNIPIRTEEGRRIREGFVVGEGYECLLTADYSQIEMRIMAHLSEDDAADRGVQVRPRLPLDHRLAGLRRARRRGDRRDAGQDQGDELRARLRPLGVRAGPAAADRPRRGARADGRVLRDLRRRPRLPRRASSTRPARAGTPRRSGPAPLPARPDQRQPAAARDGRADGAQRPDPGLGRRPDQDRDAQRRRAPSARPGWARGCCSRSTTSWSSRWRRGSGTRSRRWSASRWAARPTCRCRSTSRSAPAAAGTRPRTSAGSARRARRRAVGRARPRQAGRQWRARAAPASAPSMATATSDRQRGRSRVTARSRPATSTPSAVQIMITARPAGGPGRSRRAAGASTAGCRGSRTSRGRPGSAA